MKKLIVSVKDELVGYGEVTLAASEDVALRSFSMACNNNEIIKANLKHFSLYQVGWFDSESGVVESINPKLIVDAASCVRKKGD